MKSIGLNEQQLQKMKSHPGFIAALDQSGGSTPKALALYGIKEGAWSNEDEMFAIVHEMRTRMITSHAFNGERIIGAILFENTMDRDINGQPTANYLWNVKGVVPFLKVDKGLEAEKDGLETGNAFHATVRHLSLHLEGPGLMDDVSNVLTKFVLQLRAGRFGITGHVAVKRGQRSGFVGNDLRDIGVGLEDAHGDQRHGQPIKHHDALHHSGG